MKRRNREQGRKESKPSPEKGEVKQKKAKEAGEEEGRGRTQNGGERLEVKGRGGLGCGTWNAPVSEEGFWSAVDR